VQDGEATRLVGHLGRIGGRLVLDMQSAELPGEGLFLPLHVQVVLETLADEVVLTAFDDDWAKDNLATMTVDGEPVITATQDEMRGALAREGALLEAGRWVRLTDR